MAKTTKYGFKTQHLLCECVTDGAIRVLNTRTGQWVMVYQSPAGTKQWVEEGKFDKDNLARYLEADARL